MNTDFMEHAACQGMDPEIFFPKHRDEDRDAKRICSGCPVLYECREYALARPQLGDCGVWGGLNGAERARIRRARRRAA